MKVNGREVRFKRTIWAQFGVASLCPDNDISKLDAVLKSNFVDGNMAAASFVCIMSEAYEKSKEFEAAQNGKTYEARPLTLDEVMNLESMEDLQALFKEAVDVWAADAKTSVKGEPPKGKKKIKAAE